MVSLDQLHETVRGDSLELWPEAGAHLNIGIMMLRPTALSFVGERMWVRDRAVMADWDV
jgi:hypothetical protein